MNRGAIMRHAKSPFLALLCLVAATSASAFTSGSDGTDGPIVVLSGTTSWPLPPDGVLRCTTVSVAQGATLTFTRNALNTRVALLCTGDVTISGCGVTSTGSAEARITDATISTKQRPSNATWRDAI